jgi:hypothetical protein
MSEGTTMRPWNLIASLALASILLPSVARGAERQRPLYEPSVEDVGAWDAVVTVRLRDGSFRTLHGVEVNTVGCGGRCVESVATSALDPAQLTNIRGGGTAVLGKASSADLTPLDRRDRFSSSTVVDGLASSSGWGGEGAGADTPTRTSMTYVSPNRRVLEIFAHVRGNERLQMRVEYTRQ